MVTGFLYDQSVRSIQVLKQMTQIYPSESRTGTASRNVQIRTDFTILWAILPAPGRRAVDA